MQVRRRWRTAVTSLWGFASRRNNTTYATKNTQIELHLDDINAKQKHQARTFTLQKNLLKSSIPSRLKDNQPVSHCRTRGQTLLIKIQPLTVRMRLKTTRLSLRKTRANTSNKNAAAYRKNEIEDNQIVFEENEGKHF